MCLRRKREHDSSRLWYQMKQINTFSHATRGINNSFVVSLRIQYNSLLFTSPQLSKYIYLVCNNIMSHMCLSSFNHVLYIPVRLARSIDAFLRMLRLPHCPYKTMKQGQLRSEHKTKVKQTKHVKVMELTTYTQNIVQRIRVQVFPFISTNFGDQVAQTLHCNF